ncbi:MAG: hypothetical protein IT429_09205 [Gemmataceae bacterium]|nr:hypothetical protein [Gemmataceae bacterium]
MRLPQPTDYNEAIQDPRLCFEDEELRRGQVALTPLGLPRTCSGNFADVYQVTFADGSHSWAVKCFTRSVEGLHHRYQAVSEQLTRVSLSFLVDFRYLDRGIRVRGEWFPVLKMRWVEGFTLNEFVRHQLGRPQLLERLAAMWVRLARQLRRASMAHADLQHGNVLLVAGGQADRLKLRLIDYDGMFVPALADSPSGEVGHPNYQHPQRLREGTYDSEIDRFSHLVIYAALRAVAGSGPGLWERYDNGENLLFREQDFRVPGSSALLRELWEDGGAQVRRLVGHLVLAAGGPLHEVPLLEDILAGDEPLSLSTDQETAVDEILSVPRGIPVAGAALWWLGGAAAEADDAPEVLPVVSPPEVLPVAPPEDLTAVEPVAAKEREAPATVEPVLDTLPVVGEPPGALPAARPRQVRVFGHPAAGRAEGELFSIAAGLLARGRFAIADAVPATLHAGPWAVLLAEDFVEGRRAQPATWSAWLPSLQLSWATQAAEALEEPLPSDPSQEALASFLGLVLLPPRWLEGRRWEAVAVGDCCFFQIRAGLLHRAFPLERLAEFDTAEARIGSRTSFEPVLRRQEARAGGGWAEGDTFWLMTRPLGRWFLRQVEEWQKPWDVLGPLLERRGPRGFAEWVEELRRAGELGDGDVTLMEVCP